MNSLKLKFILILAVASFFSYSTQAQTPSQTTAGANQARSDKAVLQGQVRDPDGRAVSRARVTLLTGLVPLGERATDAEGRYRFEGLPAGIYSLVANAPGFSLLHTGVELRSGQSSLLDLHLEVSAVEEHVLVSASLAGALAPQIGTRSKPRT